MIRIFSCPAGAFVEVPLVGVDQSGGAYPRILFRPIVGPFNPETGDFTSSELLRYKGEISTSPKDDWGERNCLHRKPDGDLFLPSFDVKPVPGYTSGYSAPLDSGSTEKMFSCICTDGSDIVNNLDIGDLHTQFFHSRCAVRGRSVFGGFVDYSDTGRKYLTVSFYTITFNQNWTRYSVKTGYQFTKRSSWFEYQTYLQNLLHEDVKPVPKPAARIVPFYFKSVKPETMTAAEITRFINLVSNHGMYDPMVPDDLRDTWGALAQKSADQLDYCSVNVIQFLRELRDWRKLIPKVSKVLSPKTWSDWFLSYRYGITLTVKDTQAIVKAVYDDFWESLNSMSAKPKIIYSSQSISSKLGPRTVNTSYRYKVVTERYPSSVMNIVREMKQWGLYPTLQNAWDMVPYSFVVDWFISFDKLFEQLDDRIFWQYFNVLSLCRSQKHTTVLSGKDLLAQQTVLGDVTFTYYHREVRRHMDLPRIVLDTPSEFRNYAELTALIVQRKH